MGRGIIDVPMDSVVNYLQKFQNRLEYDDTILVGWYNHFYRLVNILSSFSFQQIEVCQQFSDNDWLREMTWISLSLVYL